MKKELVVGITAVFIVWSVLDFIIHGLLLGSLYASTPALWRPMEEMKLGLLYGAVLFSAVFFVLLYEIGFAKAPLKTSVLFGVYYGLAVGLGMGLGTYSVQPIPLAMAFAWLIGTVVESVAAALVVHWAYRAQKG